MKNEKDIMTTRLTNYINAQAQPSKENLKPFNPDDYVWEEKGTRWKQLAVILLSPLSCILVWLYLAFLSSK
jgi:hypothetical protein